MNVVIGLGNMGLAMGRRLASRGVEVVGVDLAAPRRTAWEAMTGLQAADDLEAVAWERAERVFVIVRMTDQAESVLRALAEVPGDGELTCYVVTTLEPEFARRLDDFATGRLRVLELPVSGGEIAALSGGLTAMIAGPVRDEDERFLMRTVLSHLVHFDGYGEPTLAKLFNNVASAYNARVLADLLLLADAQGLDAASLYRVLLTASGGSWIANVFMDILDDLLDKDVALLRTYLGELPQVGMGPEEALPDRLAAARALLSAPRPASEEA